MAKELQNDKNVKNINVTDMPHEQFYAIMKQYGVERETIDADLKDTGSRFINESGNINTVKYLAWLISCIIKHDKK